MVAMVILCLVLSGKLGRFGGTYFPQQQCRRQVKDLTYLEIRHM